MRTTAAVLLLCPSLAIAAGVTQPKGFEQTPSFQHEVFEGNGVLKTLSPEGSITIPVTMEEGVEYRLSLKVRGESIGGGSAARGTVSCGVPFEKVGRHTDTFNGSPSNAGKWHDLTLQNPTKFSKSQGKCRVVVSWTLGENAGHFLIDDVVLKKVDGTGENAVANGTFDLPGASIDVVQAVAVSPPATPAPTATPSPVPTVATKATPTLPKNIKLPGPGKK